MDNLTLVQVRELAGYWAAGNPPVHLMIAKYLGIKPSKPEDSRLATEEEIVQFAQMFGRG